MEIAVGKDLEGRRQQVEVGPVTAEILAGRLSPRVHRFAVMVCPVGADPDDLAQQALLKALERSATYDPRQGPVENWIWRIVVNVARDAGRLARRTEFLFDRLVAREAHAPALVPEDMAMDRIRDQELIAAVRALPRRYRTLIALRYGAALPPTEIAQLLGTTRMAVAKGTRRALDRLRIELQNKEMR